MPETTFVRDLIIILLAAFAGGAVFKKFKMPVLLGYLLAGMLLSSLFAGAVSTRVAVGTIAEIGVALLLFTIGLDFSLAKLKSLGEVIILGSLVQVFLCILIFIIVFTLFKIDFYSALFLGSVFSLSSTALVLKTLSDKGELESLTGELASGWLFMQDIYTLPLIILLPTISYLIKEANAGIAPILIFARSLVISAAAFFFIIFAGKTIVPRIIEKIADIKSRELLLVAAVCICLLFAYIFDVFGLSFALGAFVAGILLSSSSANHGIFAEVRPLRDLFATIFFVSLGFMINPGFFFSHAATILLFSFLVIAIKFSVSVALILLLGYHSKTAILVGFSLLSVGEFAFILALLGVSNNLISGDVYLTILSVSFISLIISVPFITNGERIYYKLKHIISHFSFGKKIFAALDKSKNDEMEILTNHVVVLGHGRVGKYICHALYLSQIPFVVVDYNHRLVRNLRKQGIAVIYGDPAEIDVLHFAQVKNAKIVILAYADRQTQETVVTNILTINPNVKLIARTHFEEDRDLLKSLGVDSVVQPEFEAAISMTEKLLRMINLDEQEVAARVKNLQKEYRASNGF